MPSAVISASDRFGGIDPQGHATDLFADWAVHCVSRPANAGGGRICEMSQTVQDQQRQQPVAVVALGRVARDQPLKLVARVPVNVLVTQPARLVLEGAAGPANEPLTLAFRTCSPLGCFADIDLSDAVLRRLRSRAPDQGGRVIWREATGAEAAIPVSFRGFSAAFDALQREAGGG